MRVRHADKLMSLNELLQETRLQQERALQVRPLLRLYCLDCTGPST